MTGRPQAVTVHDDGTTSNEDRLGAIGDLAFAIERGGLDGEDLLVVAGDNLIGYSLAEFVGFWRKKGGSAIAVHEVADPSCSGSMASSSSTTTTESSASRRNPPGRGATSRRRPRISTAREDLELLPRYLEEGNPPDAPGNFVAWLHTRAPVHGYRVSGEWHDIGDLGQLLEADNLLRERAGAAPARRIFARLAPFCQEAEPTVAPCCSISSFHAAARLRRPGDALCEACRARLSRLGGAAV